MFKKLIQCSKSSFNVQKVYPKCKKFVQSSKCLFKVHYVHSKFKKFIQSSKCLFKIQYVHSKFKKCIQSSKCLLRVQQLLFNLQAQRHNFPSIDGASHQELAMQSENQGRGGGALITIFKALS